jgi:predicted GIY-YIG superfamily endonuclease
MKTTLYRYFDSDNRLLYVGVSGDNTKRQSQHRRSSFWFGEIMSATFEHYDSREDALEAEAQAIKREHPMHNVAGVGIKIVHSPYHHMIYLAGMPDNGHDEMHKEFTEHYRRLFNWANNHMPTVDMVVAFAMQFAKPEAEGSPNLTKCSTCVAAYESEWFTQAYKALERL